MRIERREHERRMFGIEFKHDQEHVRERTSNLDAETRNVDARRPNAETRECLQRDGGHCRVGTAVDGFDERLPWRSASQELRHFTGILRVERTQHLSLTVHDEAREYLCGALGVAL